MTDEMIEVITIALFSLAAMAVSCWLHARSERKRKLAEHRPDMRVLNREPYSAQDAYNRRMWRQS